MCGNLQLIERHPWHDACSGDFAPCRPQGDHL
jgi:hypothetical protein